MKEINLGFQAPDYGSVGYSEPEKPKMKECFPCLTIPNNSGLAKSLTVGQEITATIRCKVVEIAYRERADEGSYSYPGDKVRVELEVTSMTPQGVRVEDEDDEESGSQALSKFMKKKPKTEIEEED